MNLPFALPAWLPWWASLVLLVAAGLWGLAFLLVPFSVIGVKARLEGLEARLDELHAEIRTLALRLQESGAAAAFDEAYAIPAPPRPAAAPPLRRPAAVPRPPIPPSGPLGVPPAPLPSTPIRPAREMPAPEGTREPLAAPRPPRREGRIEPRFDRRP